MSDGGDDDDDDDVLNDASTGINIGNRVRHDVSICTKLLHFLIIACCMRSQLSVTRDWVIFDC